MRLGAFGRETNNKSRDKCYEGSRAKSGSIGEALSSLAELEEMFWYLLGCRASSVLQLEIEFEQLKCIPGEGPSLF